MDSLLARCRLVKTVDLNDDLATFSYDDLVLRLSRSDPQIWSQMSKYGLFVVTKLIESD